MHTPSCLLSAAQVLQVPGRENTPGRDDDGHVPTPLLGSGEHASTLTHCSWDSCCRYVALWDDYDAKLRKKRGIVLNVGNVSVSVWLSPTTRLSIPVVLFHFFSWIFRIKQIVKWKIWVHTCLSIPDSVAPDNSFTAFRPYCCHVCPQPPQFNLF